MPSSPENFSPSPEVAPEVPEREAVIGRGQEERAEIFANVLVGAGSGGKPSLVARKIWNFVPLAGDAIMAYKAFTGVESGQELSKSSRVLYAAATASTLAALIYLKDGQIDAAAAARFASGLFTKAEILVPQMIKSAAEKAREASPQLSAIFVAAASWVAENKGRLSDLKEHFDNSVLTLHLDDQEPE